MPLDIHSETMKFFTTVIGLKSTFPFVTEVLNKNNAEAQSEFVAFINSRTNIVSEKIVGENTKRVEYSVRPEDSGVFRLVNEKMHSAALATKIIPESLAVALVSQFDALFSNLSLIVFEKTPELINSSEKNLTLADIKNFATVDEIKNFMIQKEVDSIMRDSHMAQFKWLEKKINAPLTKDLLSWPRFIEITERRNLLVHSSGRVTSQYIEVCENAGFKLEGDVNIGNQLQVDSEYFTLASNVVLEIGIKLSHVIWRKIQENEREKADVNLNLICYELIRKEEYNLAIELLDFATETVKKNIHLKT